MGEEFNALSTAEIVRVHNHNFLAWAERVAQILARNIVGENNLED